MKLRCIAIDDEPLALELLEDNIRKLPFLELVAGCSNPIEAMEVLRSQSVDLMFLDIQMPGLTGIQFLQSLPQKPMAILVTAYEKYALEGFNLDVVDYLVKPVALDRFIKACNKAWELYQLRTKAAGNSSPNSDPAYIFVNVDYSMLKVVLADIQWIEGLKDYIRIHLRGGAKPIITRMSMKSIEDELPASHFMRIHKSFIVSKDHITAIRKNSVFVGEMELPVSDHYKETLNSLTGKSDRNAD